MDTLYNILRNKYKTVCAELPFVKVTFDRIDMFFVELCFIYYEVRLLQYSKIPRCMLGSVTLYIFIGCILISQKNVSEVERLPKYVIISIVIFLL